MLIKSMATPPPDYLAAWMKNWTENDRTQFIEKMRGMYSKRIGFLRQSGLWDGLEQNEREFLEAGPTEIAMQDILDANWLGESIVCLLWALGSIAEIPPYDHEVSCHIMKDFPKHLPEVPRLRPVDIIARQREIAETWHWRARTRQLEEAGRIQNMLPGGLTVEKLLQMTSAKAAQAGDFQAPIDGDFPAFGRPYGNLTPEEFSVGMSIAMERHRALNWLYSYAPRNSWWVTPHRDVKKLAKLTMSPVFLR
jgi:hypothetical protein